MARSVEEVAALPDPVGEVIARWRRPNGLEISQVRVPIGVIAIIYESRPNVTVDAGVLGLQGRQRGRAARRQGGARHQRVSSGADRDALWQALDSTRDAVTFVGNPDREVIQILKRHPEAIDLIIPRGGKALKDALAGSAVPLLPHFDGHLPHLRRSRGRSEDGRGNLLQRQVQPPVGLQRDGNPAGASRGRAAFPAAASPRGCARQASSCAADERARAIVAGVTPATDADWDTEYPRPDPGGESRRLARRRDRIYRAPRLGPRRRDRDQRRRRRRALSNAKSTRRPCTSTRRPASPTASNSASAPRPESRPIACTRAARWACAS